MLAKQKTGLGHRVAKRRAKLGITQDALAEAVGMRQPSIVAIESGKVDRPKRLLEIAAALRTTQEWLLDGKGPEDVDGDDGRPVPQEFEQRPTGGIVEIDIRAGLGGGGVAGYEVRWDGVHADPVKEETWHFPSRFMREELRAPQDRIIILETNGDSMSPTILSGDRVIVDTGHCVPSPDGIYALRDRFGAIVVKRLQVLRRGDPPRIMVISDNTHHQNEEVGADEIEIVGRVLWGLKRL